MPQNNQSNQQQQPGQSNQQQQPGQSNQQQQPGQSNQQQQPSQGNQQQPSQGNQQQQGVVIPKAQLDYFQRMLKKEYQEKLDNAPKSIQEKWAKSTDSITDRLKGIEHDISLYESWKEDFQNQQQQQQQQRQQQIKDKYGDFASDFGVILPSKSPGQNDQQAQDQTPNGRINIRSPKDRDFFTSFPEFTQEEIQREPLGILGILRKKSQKQFYISGNLNKPDK